MYTDAYGLDRGVRGVKLQSVINRYSQHPNGNLLIDPLELADSGIFQCFATNDAGETNGATWLRVVSKCACTFL